MTLIRLPPLSLVGTFPQGKAAEQARQDYEETPVLPHQWGWGPMGVTESRLPSESRPQ